MATGWIRDYAANRRPEICFYEDLWTDHRTIYDRISKSVFDDGRGFYNLLLGISDDEKTPSDDVLLQEWCEEQFEKSLIGDKVLVLPGFAATVSYRDLKGLSTKERRKQGKRGGLIGMIFVAGILLREGSRALDALGETLPDWIDVESPENELSLSKYTVAQVVEMFMHDIDKPSAENWAEEFRTVSCTFQDPTPLPSWVANEEYAGRLGYIICTEDRIIPQERQVAMAREAGCRVEEFPGSHLAPFLGNTTLAAQMITKFADQFAQDERVARTLEPQTEKVRCENLIDEMARCLWDTADSELNSVNLDDLDVDESNIDNLGFVDPYPPMVAGLDF